MPLSGRVREFRSLQKSLKHYILWLSHSHVLCLFSIILCHFPLSQENKEQTLFHFLSIQVNIGHSLEMFCLRKSLVFHSLCDSTETNCSNLNGGLPYNVTPSLCKQNPFKKSTPLSNHNNFSFKLFLSHCFSFLAVTV